MSPWDPRTAIFAKHAQHVVIIHFPIAQLIARVALDFIATWTRRKDLALAAYCNFCGALLAALTGLLAWQWELEGRRLKGILLMHLVSGSASLMLIAAVWRVHRRFKQPGGELPASRGAGDPGRGAGDHDWSSGRIPQRREPPVALRLSIFPGTSLTKSPYLRLTTLDQPVPKVRRDCRHAQD